MLNAIINQAHYPIEQKVFRRNCKRELDEQGVLVFPGFLTPEAISHIAREGVQRWHLAFYSVNDHNIYLKPADPAFADNHPRNRLVSSSKGCITSDQIPAASLLRKLYNGALQCLWRSNEDDASRIIASMDDPFVVDKILSHLAGRWGSQESATRRPGAREPPPAVC